MPSFDNANLSPVMQEQFPDFLARSDEQEVADTELRGILAPGVRLNDRDWVRCRFEHCKFPDSRSQSGSFTDVIFRGCDLSNCDFTDSVFSRVSFRDCKLTGAVFLGCGFHDVHFADTLANYVLLTDSKAKTLRFTGCNLTESSLNKLTGKGYVFTECDLRRADFRETPLAGIDLTTCEIAGASLSARELRGAIVSSLQAVELAALLGVVVRD